MRYIYRRASCEATHFRLQAVEFGSRKRSFTVFQKVSFLVFACVLMLAFAACGDDEDDIATSSSSSATGGSSSSASENSGSSDSSDDGSSSSENSDSSDSSDSSGSPGWLDPEKWQIYGLGVPIMEGEELRVSVSMTPLELADLPATVYAWEYSATGEDPWESAGSGTDIGPGQNKIEDIDEGFYRVTVTVGGDEVTTLGPIEVIADPGD